MRFLSFALLMIWSCPHSYGDLNCCFYSSDLRPFNRVPSLSCMEANPASPVRTVSG
ncbi:hypothetical protein BJX68DRAFT_227980 [Aspergillus pseudodeflectus]|uniref:Uncharacterized protein n=1 Tax=Aspergillus pseudodeflectus TaxID=176178 RepID=A0ABR4L0U8_9EURO